MYESPPRPSEDLPGQRRPGTALPRIRRHRGLLGTCALAVASGCAHTAQQPDLALPFITARGPCIPVVERIEHWDQPSPLGFSALEVLRHLGGDRTSALIWMPSVDREQYSMDYGPERGRSSLWLRVAAGAGDIQYREELLAPDAPEGSECAPPVLALPVEISLRSDAFALDETFQTQIVASSVHRAELAHRVEPKGIAGGLIIDELGSRDPNRQYRVAALQVQMLLWENGSQGSVEAEIWGSYTKTAPQALRDAAPLAEPVGDREPLAVWPSAERCSEPARALPNDARPLGFSASDVLEALSSSRAPALEWSDGSRAELALEFQALASELCQAFEEDLVFEAQLRARTRDGRLDASVPVQVRAYAEGGALGEVVVQTPPADNPTSSLEFDATFHAGLSTGTLALNGSNTSARSPAPRSRPWSGSWSR